MVSASLTTVKLFLWTPFGRSLSFVMLLCLHLRFFGAGGMAGASVDSEFEMKSSVVESYFET